MSAVQNNRSAINLLKRQKNKIADLLSYYDASIFMGWTQETKNIIDNIFKEDFRHGKNFQRALKVPMRPSNIQQNGYETENKRINSIQLRNADEALQVMIKYIKDFGLTSSQDETEIPLKIFISHAHKDSAYACEIIQLLNDIGVKKNRELIFCSSIQGYGIPLGKNIYEYLKQEFTERNLFVIFLLSKDYYGSAACLNEMGATWVLSRKYQTILLPGFQYPDIRGAVNPLEICIKLDEKELKFKLNEFKDLIISTFELPAIDQSIWEKDRDKFIKQIKSITPKKKVLITAPFENNKSPKTAKTIQDFAKSRLKQQVTLAKMAVILNEKMKEFDRYLGEQITVLEDLFGNTSTECTYILDILKDFDPENIFRARTYGDIQLDFDSLPKRFVYRRTICLGRYGNVYDANLELDVSSEITPYQFSMEAEFPLHSDYNPHVLKGTSIDFPGTKELHKYIDNVFSNIQGILCSRDLKQDVIAQFNKKNSIL